MIKSSGFQNVSLRKKPRRKRSIWQGKDDYNSLIMPPRGLLRPDVVWFNGRIARITGIDYIYRYGQSRRFQ